LTALLIILGIIIFIMLILAIPVNIYSEYNEEFVLYIRYLFIKYYIYPPQEKKNKKKKKENQQKKQIQKRKKKKKRNPKKSPIISSKHSITTKAFQV
jgi:predicted membrane protein